MEQNHELQKTFFTQEALQLYQSRIVEFGVGLESTQTLNKLSKSLRRFAASHRTVARTALRDVEGLLEQLRLRQPLSLRRDEMLLQIRHFYTEILGLPEILDRVAPYGITADVIQARLAFRNQREKLSKLGL